MSKGYNSRAYVANSPSAFYIIGASDFGVPIAAKTTLVSAAVTTASISPTTANFFVETTWITAQGEGAVSAEVSIALNSATKYTVTVTQPTEPTTGGQTILGWRIYSSYSTGTEKLNAAPDTTNFTVTNPTLGTTSTIAGIAISSNTLATVVLAVVGATTAPPVLDSTGIQPPLPSVGANETIYYYAIVPNTSAQWKQQKSVAFMKSDGTAETVDIVLNHLDFIQPVYPGATSPIGGPPSSAYTQATVAPGTFMVMNGYLFVASQSGSQTTAATTFIGWGAFSPNLARGATTTDGSVVWTSLGKAGLIRFQFGNVSATPAAPAATAYELFQI